MNYLFYDLEYATSKDNHTKVCEFGYVITNEKFDVQERNNFIINPNILREEWDYRAVRKILTRTIREYENNPTFLYYFDNIKKIIGNADYVIGHSLNGDAKALNDECQRYDLPCFNYDFYDVKNIFKEYSNTKKDTSVVNMLNALGIDGEKNTHDAETDAYNTMLDLKKMTIMLDFSFEEIIQVCPNAKDRTENFIVESLEQLRLKKIQEYQECTNDSKSNDIKKNIYNKKRYMQFLYNVKPVKAGIDKFKDKKISIGYNYEDHHYRQLLNLIQLIVNEGGEVVTKSSSSDIFVKYDVYNDDGTLKNDSKLKYVLEANDNGLNIKIINFDELLKELNITEDELDSMPMVLFDFNNEEEIESTIHLNVDKKIKINKSYNVTLGDLFGDIFNEMSKDLEKE